MRNSFAKRLFKLAIVAGCVVAVTLISIGNKQCAANQTRTYFIAADEVSWTMPPVASIRLPANLLMKSRTSLCKTGRSRSGKCT